MGRLAWRVPGPGRGSLNDPTHCRVVEGVLHALTAKSAIPPILSTLLPAREDAINGSGVAYDAPRIVYVCLGLSSSKCRQRRAQRQSGNQRLPHVRLHLFEGNTCKRSGPASEVRSADVALLIERSGPFHSRKFVAAAGGAHQRMPTGKATFASIAMHSERLPSERKSLAVANEVSTLFTDSISALLTESRVG
jgi:hypothetical protein